MPLPYERTYRYNAKDHQLELVVFQNFLWTLTVHAEHLHGTPIGVRGQPWRIMHVKRAPATA